MKLALVQLDAEDNLWSIECLPQLLLLAKEANLVVFPEGMPFAEHGRHLIALDEAQKKLEAAWYQAQQLNQKQATPNSNLKLIPAFMAGGYVAETTLNGKHRRRNAVFLIDQGKVQGCYFKRIRWRSERIYQGKHGVKFTWGQEKQMSCIPLICSDAADNPSPQGTIMMAEAIHLGANTNTPIIVTSYGAGLASPNWREPLSLWSMGTGAPVAICGIAGSSQRSYYLENGIRKSYGGGGSAVFWSDDTHTRQSNKRGIYWIDTVTKKLRYQRLVEMKL